MLLAYITPSFLKLRG